MEARNPLLGLPDKLFIGRPPFLLCSPEFKGWLKTKEDRMKIITDRKELFEILEKMSSDELVKDLAETRKERMKHTGGSSEYYWLSRRVKLVLVILVSREME